MAGNENGKRRLPRAGDPNPLKGYPRGWFVISFSDELKAGDVIPLKYFGQDLVLFRTESGAPKVMDAFCPHMGAHLGHGSKVEGESIRCPFHAWRFGPDGACDDVPYAKRIPAKAKIDCWPVVEKNNAIYVWHDPRKGAPGWEIPEIPEIPAGQITGWVHSKLRVKTPPLAIVENVADFGHFIPVHGTDARKDAFENVYEGHIATQKNKGIAYPLGGGEDKYELTATYFGPAYQVTRMKGVGEGLLINCHVPIDEEYVDLRFAVGLSTAGERPMTEEFAKKYVDNLRQGFLQDVRIWEHKVYLDKPVLCDGDGPIAQLRRWYSQFFEATAEAEATAPP